MANWVPYDAFLGAMGAKNGGPATVDLDSGTFKVSIHTAAYVPDRASQKVYGDLSAQVAGVNYPAGGVALANPTWACSGHVWTWDADDPAQIAQSDGGFSNGRILVLRESVTGALVAYLEAGADFGNVAGPLNLQLAAGGIATMGG